MDDEQLERIRELIGMHRQFGHALSIQGEADLLAEVDRLRAEVASLRTTLINAHNAGMSLGQDVERLQGIITAVRELHGPDDLEFLARQGWAYCKCGDFIHPCDTARALGME